MKEIFLKVRTFILETWAIVAAVSGLIGVGWMIYAFINDPDDLQITQTEEAAQSGPVAVACDAQSEPVTQRLKGGLARLDCEVDEIRICDFQDSAKSAAETSHGMESHLMQVSAELSGKRFPIIGNGRGAQAEQLAFDNLYNNLILVLEENNLCR